MSVPIRLSVISTLLLAALALGAGPSTAEAQFGKRLKDAVKRTAEDKAIQKATEKENEAIDDAIEGGGEESGAAEETAAAAADSETATGTATASEATSETGIATTPAKPKNAGEGAFVNFDFVPGERVLFYDDYAGDNVGDFPRRLEFAEGNAASRSGKAPSGFA